MVIAVIVSWLLQSKLMSLNGLHSDAGAGSRDADEVGFLNDDRGLDHYRRCHSVRRKAKHSFVDLGFD